MNKVWILIGSTSLLDSLTFKWRKRIIIRYATRNHLFITGIYAQPKVKYNCIEFLKYKVRLGKITTILVGSMNEFNLSSIALREFIQWLEERNCTVIDMEGNKNDGK